MRGGGGGAGPAFGPAPFLLGGVGAAKGLLPCFLVPTRNQPTACTLALWWLKFGPTEFWGGGGQNFFAYCGRRVCIWTWVLRNFFLVYGPPNPCGGTRVPTSGIPPPCQ